MFLMLLRFSPSGASMSFCINSLYNFFLSFLEVLRVVTSVQNLSAFFKLHILLFTVILKFLLFSLLKMYLVNSSNSGLFILNHNGFRGPLSMFSSVCSDCSWLKNGADSLLKITGKQHESAYFEKQ